MYQRNKVTPFIWMTDKALEAAEFYVGLFKDSRILTSTPIVVELEIAGQRLSIINGGPQFQLSPAFSLLIECEDQAEVDHYWEILVGNGGAIDACGWCRDRYGLSWQVVPKRFFEMMSTGTPEQIANMMKVAMPMEKLVIAELETAFNS